jgi:hypothetical protein
MKEIWLPCYGEFVIGSRGICFAVKSNGFREALVANVALFSYVIPMCRWYNLARGVLPMDKLDQMLCLC